MTVEVRLPRLGQGMESGTIVRWLKSEGDRVEKGEPLFEVDTDKATQEVEAESSGVLLRIAVQEGEVPVGGTVGLIGEPGEAVDVPAPPAAMPSEPASRNGGVETPAAEHEEPDEARSTDFRAAISGALDESGRVKASPLARRMARERGVELAELTGTGPEGRIVAEDVERASMAPVVAPAERAREAETVAARAAPAVVDAEPAEVESVPLTKLRTTIARRLTEAWQVPVFQLTVSVEMTHANTLIERSRELDPEARPTVTDLLAKVCARALVRHPEVNVQFTEGALLRFATANVGLAVAAPQGLVVPVIHSAERLSLVEIALRRAAVVGRAREGKLQQADLEGGTFTISNLGMFGVEQFSAVLNPPQAAILAVGATVDRPVAVDGDVVVRPMMTVTLTVDHRAVDGAPAAEFLRTVKTFLEDPALAL
jgi:pyruvate dehydrogenase E2 component (dihydrolipoamide acetyltransferase)